MRSSEVLFGTLEGWIVSSVQIVEMSRKQLWPECIINPTRDGPRRGLTGRRKGRLGR